MRKYAAILQSNELCAGEKAALSYIIDDCLDDNEGKCYYTYMELVRKTGLTERTVKRNIKDLITKGYLKKDKVHVPYKQNVYMLGDKLTNEWGYSQQILK